MKGQWQYLVLRMEGGREADNEKRLNNLGTEGWEVVAVSVQFTNHTIYMKRPSLRPQS